MRGGTVGMGGSSASRKGRSEGELMAPSSSDDPNSPLSPTPGRCPRRLTRIVAPARHRVQCKTINALATTPHTRHTPMPHAAHATHSNATRALVWEMVPEYGLPMTLPPFRDLRYEVRGGAMGWFRKSGTRGLHPTRPHARARHKAVSHVLTQRGQSWWGVASALLNGTSGPGWAQGRVLVAAVKVVGAATVGAGRLFDAGPSRRIDRRWRLRGRRRERQHFARHGRQHLGWRRVRQRCRRSRAASRRHRRRRRVGRERRRRDRNIQLRRGRGRQ